MAAPQVIDIQEGSVIQSSSKSYTAEKLLGECGFGSVYKVSDG